MEIGLALSGGAARGIAHIGVLKYIDENSLPLSIISGTSAGSIVGSLYSKGLSAKEIEIIAHEINWRQFIRHMARLQLPKWAW